jgi:hypothetical protein
MESSRRAAPLAIFQPSRTRPPSVLRTGSQLALPSGQVAGDLKPLGDDRRRRVALYELRIANETGGPLIGFAYAVGEPRMRGTVSWSTVTVPPHSSVAVPIELPWPKRGRSQRVVAELHADGAHLTLDAGPPRGMSDGMRRLAQILCAALALALLSGAYALARPRVTALAVPERIVAGAPFEIAYAFGDGILRGRYAVTAADGRTVAHGTLDPHATSLGLTVPAGSRSMGYDITVTGSNLLGDVRRSMHVVALVPHTATAAKVAPKMLAPGAPALDADTVAGGQAIVVRYAAALGSGDVKLLDQDGTERASALLSKRGTSLLIAPDVKVPEDFRVVVVSRRGAKVAQTELALRIVPAPPAISKAANAGDAGKTADAIASGASPIAVLKPAYRSGETISVDVRRYAPHMAVALLNDRGEELQRLDVVAGETRLDLEAPPVERPTKMLVVATFARGVGEDSVIAPVLIRPR